MTAIASFLVLAVIIAASLTWLVRQVANRYGLVLGPSSSRHIHATPIPRLGGVAIFATFVLLYAAFCLGVAHGWIVGSLSHDVTNVLLPGIGLFLVGLLDDLIEMKAVTKLLAQVAGGCSLFYSGLHFACFQWQGMPPWFNSGVCLLTTVFWVVLVCNAINLIDGLDGLASGSTLFSMVTIFTVAMVQGRNSVAIAVLLLGGAMLGFLVFNFNPASIFLGDSGSLFVGFMLSGFVLAEAPKQSVADSLAIPIISLALPLTDTALSVIRRFLSGHSLFGADREHIHHKLLELGLTQRQVVWILYGFSATCAVLSLALLHPSDLMELPMAGILLLIIFFGVRKLGYHELAEFQRVWKRVAQQKQVFARNIAMRKASMELRKLHDFDAIQQVLENCLKQDFDGFELVLYADAFGIEGDPGNKTVERVWRNSYQEKIIFTLELSSARHGVVGRLSCHREIGTGWLVDTDLLAGGLRTSLGTAIDNCVSHSLKSPFAADVPEIRQPRHPHHVQANFQSIPVSLAPFTSQEFAATAGGDD